MTRDRGMAAYRAVAHDGSFESGGDRNMIRIADIRVALVAVLHVVPLWLT
jgi:hypothetical protein